MKTAHNATERPQNFLTDHDVYLFREGSHSRLHDKLGAHACTVGGATGVHFSVWAPNAKAVSVIGDFNDWNNKAHRLQPRGDNSGIWEGFVASVESGTCYKFHISSLHHGYQVDKADPFAFYSEVPPRRASRVWALDYEWNDGDWMARRRDCNALDAPMSAYEVHLGSWRRVPEQDNRPLSYREIAPLLAEHVNALGFTHVELMPITEHPFYGSWGYQTTGYFAPTARYGTPQDFMYLVDFLHQAGIGVILDWVPSHFPSDEHGLGFFDGTHLFEHADPRQGFHPEWNSAIFNYDRNEVRTFLMSSALFWLEKYHIDGLRVDAVASMLYLDYGRKQGEWIPNRHGGRENLGAMEFLRNFNEAVYRDHPDTQTIAEESTAWPMVSRPTYTGGLGFGMKWNMGWMHDTLKYFQQDPIHRRHHQGQISFSIWYAFTENFLLPLSHDEVVHGKGSLIGKMPGDEWQQFANLRSLYGYMWAHPGKKLLFMGGEFGQRREWAHEESLEWHVLQYPLHGGLQRWVGDLNRCYREHPALYEQDFTGDGFAWVDSQDWEASVLSFLRHGKRPEDTVLIVCNFTPQPRHNYRVGVPGGGYWQELLNSDAVIYGGSGAGNLGGVEAAPVATQGYFHSLFLTLPPLSVLYLKPATSA
ncbi:1,4-alpha-glucan branching protein GlgB [Immundisolibacter sp.]|uniref:1,4-alpha-glucan branching protein GlgB n=1 Tax=Immundisolibacter sp. TaxID=1934948 RepID=UPI003563D693